MNNSVAIAQTSALVPAHLLLLRAAVKPLAIAAVTLAFSVPGHAETIGNKPKGPMPGVAGVLRSRPAAVTLSGVQLVATNPSIRSANDLGSVTSDLTGTIASRNAPSAVRPIVSHPPQRVWYPDAHNYLRPYHYRWRYWTPG